MELSSVPGQEAKVSWSGKRQGGGGRRRGGGGWGGGGYIETVIDLYVDRQKDRDTDR